MAKTQTFFTVLVVIIAVSRAQLGALNDLISCASYAKQLYGKASAL